MKFHFGDLLWVAHVLVALSLGACGGGGSESTNVNPPPTNPASQGIWNETRWDNMNWQ